MMFILINKAYELRYEFYVKNHKHQLFSYQSFNYNNLFILYFLSRIDVLFYKIVDLRNIIKIYPNIYMLYV